MTLSVRAGGVGTFVRPVVYLCNTCRVTERRDFVDAVRAQWAAVRPDLDTSSVDLVGRIFRAATIMRNQLDASFAGEGINRAEFDLLSALRRSPGPVTPGELTRQTTSSAAATTKRIHQLVERGLVERMVDERDRRSAHIALTERGTVLIDRAMARNLEAEGRLLSALDESEQEVLTDGLAKLLRVIEDPADTAALTTQLERLVDRATADSE